MRNTEGPLSGRRREAAQNDVGILDAARSVFLEDPSAPISAVAEMGADGSAMKTSWAAARISTSLRAASRRRPLSGPSVVRIRPSLSLERNDLIC